ncbi:MAG: hypothetical protein ACR2OR_14700 [Hyphomicrobiales bacterium]
MAARNLDLSSALEEARAGYAAAHPKSAEYYEAAKAVMPGGNTRTVLHYGPYPFTVVKGEGARILDADGHDYADFLGSTPPVSTATMIRSSQRLSLQLLNAG